MVVQKVIIENLYRTNYELCVATVIKTISRNKLNTEIY